ncbi:T9SS type B sorting domain-containing protein [Flavobacterium sp. NST-5]|uniref:T9SS type B sorting domain-containing protein n=1 Tax=Flavobacterium ichthyis TaxID=2698827 RepID=A0ABW9Z406_9FLAO|nr:gliding motility-associated C-terminal domain-containing protein [Flavobacterium ichthyis]NBL63580.1 T9SS type B sorting domain-containing protein [Flavobacterium ichthyis]
MKNLILITLLLISANNIAQTTNIGEVTVMPNTIISTVAAFDNQATGTFVNDGEFYVYSHFNNDGLVSFTPGLISSFTRFQGTNNQLIDGSVPADFYDVFFNNPSNQPAFQLAGEMRIFGTTDFFNGIVKNDDFGGLMVYQNTANHVNTDNDSHVDGYVQKNGNEQFTYPIGDGGYYRFAQILPTSPNNSADKFTGKYFLENSNDLYPHQSRVGNLLRIDDQEYWTMDRTEGQTEIMLTLSWDQTTTPDFIWGDLNPSIPENETITIARWDETQNLWVDEGGIVEIGANGIGTGTVTSFFTTSGFGVFTLAKVRQRVEPAGNIVIYNGVTPNGDGLNDYFIIDGIRNYPNNKVMIYNRWGVKVFETTSYDSNGNVFNGYSEGRATFNPEDRLPSGTYYYILTYEIPGSTGNRNIEKAGYLYINDK